MGGRSARRRSKNGGKAKSRRKAGETGGFCGGGDGPPSGVAQSDSGGYSGTESSGTDESDGFMEAMLGEDVDSGRGAGSLVTEEDKQVAIVAVHFQEQPQKEQPLHLWPRPSPSKREPRESQPADGLAGPAFAPAENLWEDRPKRSNRLRASIADDGRVNPEIRAMERVMAQYQIKIRDVQRMLKCGSNRDGESGDETIEYERDESPNSNSLAKFQLNMLQTKMRIIRELRRTAANSERAAQAASSSVAAELARRAPKKLSEQIYADWERKAHASGLKGSRRNPLRPPKECADADPRGQEERDETSRGVKVSDKKRQ